MTEKIQESFPCSECQAGMMHLQHITCDMCGRREYDSRAISWLVTILNPETGKTSVLKRRPRPPQKRRSGTSPFPE
jgi:hypothetical protein